MTLDKGAIGQSYAVTKIDLPDQVEHRLEAIGMTIGGKVRGARFAMGRGITEKIEVI